jgi:hypothetical protein
MSRGRERTSLLETLRSRGLSAPAALLAEMHRPLAPLLSDLASVASPVVEPLLGRDRVARLASEEGVDHLLSRLSADRSDDENRSG